VSAPTTSACTSESQSNNAISIPMTTLRPAQLNSVARVCPSSVGRASLQYTSGSCFRGINCIARNTEVLRE